MEQTFRGYKFDGDPDGIRFLGLMSEDEIVTIVKSVDNRSKANILGDNHNHFEVTKSSEGIYMISKISVSSSWFS